MRPQLKSRQQVIKGIFLLIILILIIDLFIIQVVKSEYKEAGNDNSIRFEVQQAARGLIFDRNNSLMVANIASYDLMVIPREVGEIDTSKICEMAEISLTDFKLRLQNAFEYSEYKESLISEQLKTEVAHKINESLNDFPGFYIRSSRIRYYPIGAASHIIGYLGEIKSKFINKLTDGTKIISISKNLYINSIIWRLSENNQLIDSLPAGKYKTKDGQKFSVIKNGFIHDIYKKEKKLTFRREIDYYTNKLLDFCFRQGDLEGKTGIEDAYDQKLRGKNGMKMILVDAHNRAQGSFKNGEEDTIATPGKNIIVTIDMNLQSYGEKLMRNKIGAIVAIEPNSGEILSLISSPNYNPNMMTGRERSQNYLSLSKNPDSILFNRALNGTYPPASPFKLINGLIALQEETLNSHNLYYCENGFRYGNNQILRCHEHKPSVNIYSAIEVSCNSYFCNVWENFFNKYQSKYTAYSVWRKHVESFGLGNYLNNDLTTGHPGDIKKSTYYDNYYKKGRWNSSTILSMSIGQGEILVTPMQMANLTAAIANRGYYYTPHIIKKIEGESVPEKFNIKHYTSIDSNHFETIIKGMEMVLANIDGSAFSSRVINLSICGKTGTAQNPTGEDHSIFIAFAPKEDPQIAIAVCVENGTWGADWAAPIATLMIEHYLKNGEITNKNLEKEMINGNLLNRK